jgi:SpoVK/Ycf46/Vps4 family AAA+-type ATPase
LKKDRTVQRRGPVVLFSGRDAAARTAGAAGLARAWRRDLVRVDVANVVSKYIGETEKNLARIFDAAEKSNSVLFFDEADALFGRRSEVKDAHDRYANLVRRRLRTFDGIVILATSRPASIDPASLRRPKRTPRRRPGR